MAWYRPLAPPLLLVLTALLVSSQARAQGESHYEDDIAPETVEELEITSPQFEEEKKQAARFPATHRWLRSKIYVTEDSLLELRLRSYYLYRKSLDNSRREAWTYGGSVRYKTGWIQDRFNIDLELFVSQPIHAPSDRDGTLLLRPLQRQYAVLGRSGLQIPAGLNAHHTVMNRPGWFVRTKSAVSPTT